MSTYLVCRDCRKPFEFTSGEKAFYKKQGWENPIRCKTCQVINKRYYGMKSAISNRQNLKRRHGSYRYSRYACRRV